VSGTVSPVDDRLRDILARDYAAAAVRGPVRRLRPDPAGGPGVLALVGRRGRAVYVRLPADAARAVRPGDRLTVVGMLALLKAFLIIEPTLVLHADGTVLWEAPTTEAPRVAVA